MSTRSIEIRMRANVSGFTAEMAKARQSLDEVVKAADKNAQVADTAGGRMVQSARLQADEWNRVGNTLTTMGAAGTVALGGAAKAAISYESAFAGVKKTVNATPAEIDKLSNSIRSMSREMPASQTEIAGVAEAAGQLGIQTANIEDFTKTMIAMGSSTSMSSEEAATQLARFANIMGTSQNEFSNMGSSIVALGNNFATTESEITAMSLRLASAGHQAGMTEGDIFGIATALSSVGIEADAGGTAFSKVMLEMNNSVKSGNDKLKVFADTAGMTAEQFSALWKSNPSEALTAFVQGLADIENAGGNTQPILDELGMTDVRVGNALRSSAAAAGTFSDAITMGNQAYDENTALMTEYGQRVGTTESQLKIFKNTITDLGISLGTTLLPGINLAVGGLTDFVGTIADLPAPLLTVVGYLGTAVSVATLAGGAFFKLAPSVMETWTAFGNLAGVIPGVSKALDVMHGPAGKGAVQLAKIAGWTGIGLVAISTIYDATDAMLEMSGIVERNVQGVEELQNSLLVAQGNGATFYDTIFGSIGDIDTTKFTDLAEVFERIARPGILDSQAGRFLTGPFNSSGFEEVNEQMEVLDQQITTLSKTDLGAATEQFKAIYDEAGGGQQVFDDMIAAMPGYKKSLLDLASAAGVPIEDTDLLKLATGEMNGELGLTQAAADGAATGIMGVADGMEEATSTTERAADAMKEYLDILANYAALNMSADEASLNYMDTLNGLQDAYDQAAEGVTDLNELDLIRKTTMGELAKASQTQIDAMHQQIDAEGNLIYSSAEIGAQASSNVDDFIAQAQAMGLSADAAVDLASNYGMLPADVNTVAEFDKWKAEQDAADWAGVLTTEDGKTILATAEFDAAKARSDAIMLTGDYEPLRGSLVSTAYFEPGEAIPKVKGYKQELGFIPPEARTDGVFIFGAAKAGVDSYKSGSLGTIPKTTNTTPRFLSAVATGATNAYKGNLNTIPGARNTNLNVRDNGSWTIQSVKNGLASVHDKTVTLTVNRVENAVKGLFGKAYGGPIYGPGTGTSDDVPIMASNGEYMIRESATRKNRRLLDMINYGGFNAQKALGLAEGGPVDRSTMTPARLMVPFATKAVSQPISLDGMRVTGTLDLGDGLEARMDARIDAHDRVAASVGRTGR